MKIVVDKEHQKDIEQAVELAFYSLQFLSQPFDAEAEPEWFSIQSDLLSDAKASRQDAERARSAFHNVRFSVGMDGEIDTSILEEIGNVYKQKHLQAKEAGDEKMAQRTFGAMVAIKEIRDMAKDPEF